MRSNWLPEIVKRSETGPFIKEADFEMQRTHKEEFYAHYDGALDLKSLNKALRRWERVYNTIRPHHSLGRRTPTQYLQECFPSLAPAA